MDLRVINPIDYGTIVASVKKTKRLCAVDGGWENCGLAGEIIAGVMERILPSDLASSPTRLTLPSAPSPTSRPLEDAYYIKVEDVVQAVSCKLKVKS